MARRKGEVVAVRATLPLQRELAYEVVETMRHEQPTGPDLQDRSRRMLGIEFGKRPAERRNARPTSLRMALEIVLQCRH